VRWSQSTNNARVFVCAVLTVVQGAGSAATEISIKAGAQSQRSKHPVGVVDAIRMTRLADHSYTVGGPSAGRVAQYSADGRQFVVVIRKGNIALNTNEYSLLVWQTNDVFQAARPRILLTLSSSSNREAIQCVHWMADNKTLAFLGEVPGELQQVYMFNTETRALQKITNHVSNILAFSFTSDERELFYTADAPIESIWNENTRSTGVIVSTQPVHQLILGEKGGGGFFNVNPTLWVQSLTETDRPRELIDRVSPWSPTPFVSPDSKYVVVATQVANAPEAWKSYEDPELRRYLERRSRVEYTDLQIYTLTDTASGMSRVLLNSPMEYLPPEIAWSPDSRSVVIGHAYLPLEGTSGEEKKIRQTQRFTVEVGIEKGEAVRITDDERLRYPSWEARTGRLIIKVQGDTPQEPEREVWFQKRRQKWERLAHAVSDASRPQIILNEGMNCPPKIVAIDRDTHKRVAIFDLNPEFEDLKVAKVEEIGWKGRDGSERKGGLYYPVDYVPGTKYPLVIQTHGWNKNRFWIDGPWTTAFAAQPLAGKNIMVLQLDESFADEDTPAEVDREVAAYEGAIHYLAEKGLIDRSRVGIIGFSRTCLFVSYALSHSKYRFAAASLTDGVDGSYVQYVLSANSFPGFAQTVEGVNGGPPYGEQLKSWLLRSSGFNLDKVKSPVRITALNPASLLAQWEWFVGLVRLEKPVEMIYMKDGDHILQRPADRMISQQGNVDWFCFWLKHEEDKDSSKAAQYARWRTMRVDEKE
jgi:dipeptidyl aminopeptidase/acylaminoacyl peptidase